MEELFNEKNIIENMQKIDIKLEKMLADLDFNAVTLADIDEIVKLKEKFGEFFSQDQNDKLEYILFKYFEAVMKESESTIEEKNEIYARTQIENSLSYYKYRIDCGFATAYDIISLKQLLIDYDAYLTPEEKEIIKKMIEEIEKMLKQQFVSTKQPKIIKKEKEESGAQPEF